MFHLSGPAIVQAISALDLKVGSRGLDAGCGVGCHTDLLAEHIGEMGRLTALDISEENLLWARRHRSHANEVDWVQGDIRALPFEDSSFDWVWCADTLWPAATIDHPGDVLEEFARVVRPGGTIALLFWSSQSLLPGHPGLEARLNEAFVDSVPYLNAGSPELHFMRAKSWLQDLALGPAQGRTFVSDIAPPKNEVERQVLAECFRMFWDGLDKRVSSSDWNEYRRLCRPQSPDFLGDTYDYAGFLTYTMFWVQTDA